ncbi:MAG: hypothetical protein AAF733_04955 [Verrucomicrobiota bacterium]
MTSTYPGLKAGERVLVADDKISIELADGWSETELNQGDVLAGFATQDQRYSLFLNSFEAGGSMQEVIDATMVNFEEKFTIRSEEKAVTGQTQGPGDKKWPAIYKTMEADFDRGDQVFGMRFYLLIFDTGTSLYLIQASATLPVRDSRETQIIEMIRSIVAKP